jgi:hypothetical protein
LTRVANNALHNRRHSDAAFLGQRMPVDFDALDLVQRFAGEMASAAVRTTHQRRVFDHRQRPTFAVVSRDKADLCVTMTTWIANRRLPLLMKDSAEDQRYILVLRIAKQAKRNRGLSRSFVVAQ